jgi:hypothetical protein
VHERGGRLGARLKDNIYVAEVGPKDLKKYDSKQDNFHP